VIVAGLGRSCHRFQRDSSASPAGHTSKQVGERGWMKTKNRATARFAEELEGVRRQLERRAARV
jgi:hypothetical protein